MSTPYPIPGPWTVTAPENDEWDHLTEVQDESGHTIAQTDFHEERNDKSPNRVDEANARLIAAAPDLLKAVQDIISAFEDGGGAERSEAIMEGQDAIKKAIDG